MADLDRRALLAGTAAAGTELLPYARPARAEQPGPIELAYVDLMPLWKEWDEACLREWDAEERYVEPPRPRWHPVNVEGGYEMVRQGDEGIRACLSLSDENIERVRSIATAPFKHVDDAPAQLAWHLYQHRVRVARRTLAQVEAWQSEVARRKVEAGLIDATATQVAASEVVHARIDELFEVPAATFRELAFQAAVIIEEWDEHRVDTILARLIALAGIKPREA